MRKAYLDNIRWATVLLVLVYHVCYMYNGAGVLGGIPGARSLAAFDVLASIVYPWFMVLLFVVAGVSARLSLQKRTGRQFIRERAVKLLVPSTLGLFVVHWITGYLNIKMGGGLAYIPSFLVYPISVISGIGPLWFAQMLFLFSCALAALKKLDRGDHLWRLGGRTGLAGVLLLFVPVWGAAQVLNVPVLTMYRFGIYFVSFLTGYYVFSHENVVASLERSCVPLMAVAACGAVGYAVYCRGADYTAPACLQSFVTNLYLWVVVAAVFGGAKRFFNRETAFTRYMTKAGWGLYVLHYPVLIVTCYILHYHCALPVLWNYIIALVVELAVTALLWEAVRRIPVVRYVVLGQKGGKREMAALPCAGNGGKRAP